MRHPQGGGAGGNGALGGQSLGGDEEGRVTGGVDPSVTSREGPGSSGSRDRAPVRTRAPGEG